MTNDSPTWLVEQLSSNFGRNTLGDFAKTERFVTTFTQSERTDTTLRTDETKEERRTTYENACTDTLVQNERNLQI